MKSHPFMRQVTLVALLFWSCFVYGLVALPAVNRVVDQTGTLTAEQKSAIQENLQQLEVTTGAQIAVVIIPTTQPETIEQYAVRLEEAWKLGRKGVDDGVLLIIAKTDRTMRIEVGYGLEGPLNDAICKRIIEETIVPQFKQSRYFNGIQAGLNQIMKVVKGEPLPKPKANAHSVHFEDIMNYILMTLFISYFASLAKSDKKINTKNVLLSLGTSSIVSFLVYLFTLSILVSGLLGLFSFLFTLWHYQDPTKYDSGSGGGFFGGSSGGSFGGGGFGGGGGFSGGGGSSGGGGASGRW